MSTEISHAEAQQLEEKFLGALDTAQEVFTRILETRAWTQLGYATFVEWWQVQVLPRFKALEARPQPELREKVIQQIHAEELELPKTQRHKQSEIAKLVGVSERTVARSLQATSVRQSDLAATPEVVDATVDSLERIDRQDLVEKLRSGESTVDQVHDILAAEAAAVKKTQTSTEERTAELLVAVRRLRRTTREVATKFIELAPLGVAESAPQVFAEHIEWLRTALGHIESTLTTGTVDDELVALIERESQE